MIRLFTIIFFILLWLCQLANGDELPSSRIFTNHIWVIIHLKLIGVSHALAGPVMHKLRVERTCSYNRSYDDSDIRTFVNRLSQKCHELKKSLGECGSDEAQAQILKQTDWPGFMKRHLKLMDQTRISLQASTQDIHKILGFLNGKPIHHVSALQVVDEARELKDLNNGDRVFGYAIKPWELELELIKEGECDDDSTQTVLFRHVPGAS